jgi:hypothetical protein
LCTAENVVPQELIAAAANSKVDLSNLAQGPDENGNVRFFIQPAPDIFKTP